MKKEDKKDKKYKRGIFQNYLVYIIGFVSVAVVVMLCAIGAVNKPATEFVHRLEKEFSIEIRDIQVNNDNALSKDKKLELCDKIGNITVESKGVNCDIYYGANRVSYRNGAGFDADSQFFGEGEVSVIKGFEETVFSNLKHIEEEDIITVKSGDNSYTYSVVTAEYSNADLTKSASEYGESLVICGICSDFSEHSGESLYVIAQRIEGEGN